MTWFPDSSLLAGGAENIMLLADTTVPTVTAKSINTAGTQLTLTLSECLNDPVDNHAGFSLAATLGVPTLTYVPGTAVDQIVFSLSRTILNGETITLTYTPGTIRDNANNVLASISGGAVTNNSTQTTTTTTTT